jgi:8-oxo-dGTP pyrophosphatase MutT (NUDIX family)
LSIAQRYLGEEFFKESKMSATAKAEKELATSCGTLVVNNKRQVLLCHGTDTSHWDIPKGLQEPGESSIEAAKRELWEETGLGFDETLFEDIGCFDYRRDKRLHLYQVRAQQDLDSLGHLVCTSCFPHRITGKPTPEVDGFRWGSRDDVRMLCWPGMAVRLLSLDW